MVQSVLSSESAWESHRTLVIQWLGGHQEALCLGVDSVKMLGGWPPVCTSRSLKGASLEQTASYFVLGIETRRKVLWVMIFSLFLAQAPPPGHRLTSRDLGTGEIERQNNGIAWFRGLRHDLEDMGIQRTNSLNSGTCLFQTHHSLVTLEMPLNSLNFSALNYKMQVQPLLCPHHRTDMGMTGDDNRHSL